jgi:hypothetical protein
MAKKKRVAKTDKYGVQSSSVSKGQGAKGTGTTRKYRSKSIETIREGDKGGATNRGRRGVVTRQSGSADRGTVARKTVNKSVNADAGTVKKTKYVIKKDGSVKESEKMRTVGKKRATKKLDRMSRKQDRMDAKTARKAARKPRKPTMGRDVPLPKSK